MSETIELPEYYDSIDYLPMIKWDKINKTMDVSLLLKSNGKINDEQKEVLIKVWEAIYGEFVSVFGFGDYFNDIVNLETKIARLKLKMIIKGDESIQNFINANEKVLSEMKNKNSVGDVYKTKMAIEKKLGIRISLNDCSVREYYEYLRHIKSL